MADDTSQTRVYSWNQDTIKNILVAVSTLAAILSAVFVYWQSDISSNVYSAKVSLTKNAYKGTIDSEGDLTLRATGDVFLPQKVTIVPRYRIPGKYSDAETLGESISYDKFVDIEISSEGVLLKIQGVTRALCYEGEVNRQRCRDKVPKSQYYLKFSFAGNETARAPVTVLE